MRCRGWPMQASVSTCMTSGRCRRVPDHRRHRRAGRRDQEAGRHGDRGDPGHGHDRGDRVPARPAAHRRSARRRDGGDAQPAMAGHDGPANILAALQAAASPLLRGLGCVVVSRMRSTPPGSSARPTPPASPRSPPRPPGRSAGSSRDRSASSPAPQGGSRSPVPGLARQVRTGLVTMTLGDDGELLRAAAGRFDGLVIAAFGAGHVPAAMVPALAALAGEIPVVLASRTGAGPVLAATYGFPGSEQDLVGRGLISAGFLDPLKARLLLHVLLSGGATREQVSAAFQEADGYGQARSPRREDGDRAKSACTRQPADAEGSGGVTVDAGLPDEARQLRVPGGWLRELLRSARGPDRGRQRAGFQRCLPWASGRGGAGLIACQRERLDITSASGRDRRLPRYPCRRAPGRPGSSPCPSQVPGPSAAR